MKAIMYHYIRRDSPGLPYLKYLHLDDFNRQLDHFQKEEGFISKKDFLDSFQTGIIPEGVILTFDDGLKEHFDIVLPCLKERNLWGIFYIPTGPLSGGRMPAVHVIHGLVGRYSSEKVFNALSQMLDGNAEHTDYDGSTYVRNDGDMNKVKIKRLLNYHLDNGKQDAVLKELAANLGGDNLLGEKFYMAPGEIKTLHEEGMLIGSHSVNHYLMEKLNEREQEKEIKDSFKFIEKASGGTDAKTFCYPFGGVHSYNDVTLRLLKKYGCKFAFAVEPRDISKEDVLSSPLILPRYDCNYFEYGQYR